MSFTPTLHAQGKYSLIAPWTTATNDTYTCIAIRTFADITAAGEDVRAVYYTSMGLTDGVTIGGAPWYWADEVQRAPNIITLQDPVGAIIYVPDTFIGSGPDLAVVVYNQCVISVNVGALPDYVDFTAITAQVQTDVANMTGITATATLTVVPCATNPTYAQHTVLELARIAAIASPLTPAAQIAALTAQLTAANAINAQMAATLLAHGLITT